MSIAPIAIALMDNGGRRFATDRRQFSYTGYLPERRTGEDRRVSLDRRDGIDQRSSKDRRDTKIIEFKTGKDLRKEKDRRSGVERRAVYAAALTT
jgi:hypothetical protein